MEGQRAADRDDGDTTSGSRRVSRLPQGGATDLQERGASCKDEPLHTIYVHHRLEDKLPERNDLNID